MLRLRPGTAITALATCLVAGPILATVALASDVTVQRGDSLTAIARRTGTSIERLVELNGIPDPNRIWVGQVLRTTPAPSAAAPAPAPAAPAPAAAPVVHVVRRGEHLTGIARHYGVSVAAIVAANGIANPSRIFNGQQLAIPGAAPAAAPAPAPPAPGSPGMPSAMAELVARRSDVRDVIVAEASRQGVPPAFALAVAWQESGWQQGVVSSANAIGVMQLLPSTADWVGSAMLGTAVDPRDLHQNVRAGVRLLRHYLDRYAGNRDLALAAYYQGQRAADQHGVYAVTRPYIASITVLERLFGG